MLLKILRSAISFETFTENTQLSIQIPLPKAFDLVVTIPCRHHEAGRCGQMNNCHSVDLLVDRIDLHHQERRRTLVKKFQE